MGLVPRWGCFGPFYYFSINRDHLTYWYGFWHGKLFVDLSIKDFTNRDGLTHRFKIWGTSHFHQRFGVRVGHHHFPLLDWPILPKYRCNWFFTKYIRNGRSIKGSVRYDKTWVFRISVQSLSSGYSNDTSPSRPFIYFNLFKSGSTKFLT